MINVLASITVKGGCVEKFVEIFKDNIPNVLAEKGCIEYMPTVDVETDIPPQVNDCNVVTIIEKWESLDDLYAHLKAPHMDIYREKVKGLVESVSLKVLQDA
ncbi:MAG: putative quinol monooxygenase [Planctomycetota bacterium]|jgi:quinol monooxygenase YgiN